MTTPPRAADAFSARHLPLRRANAWFASDDGGRSTGCPTKWREVMIPNYPVGSQNCCSKCFEAFVAENPDKWWTRKMMLCSTCGNKRCPKATDHTLACTGSNAPGQEGSAYT